MLPVWKRASRKVKKEISRKKMPMLGVAAAFSFLVMMFNVPVPGGTTAHAIGSALIAILLGPYAAVFAVTIALVIQALFFGDGGVLALAVNCFNMAFIMPYTAYYLFKIIRKIIKGKRGEYIGAFIGSYVSVNVAALCAAIEFGIQPLLFKDALGRPLYSPYGLSVSIPAMLVPHLLVVGILEGIITVGVYGYIKGAAPEFIYNKKEKNRKLIYVIVGMLIVLTPLGLLASGRAFGEWSSEEMKKLVGYVPKGMANGFKYNSPFTDYSVKFFNDYIGYILSALIGVIVILIVFKIINKINAKED